MSTILKSLKRLEKEKESRTGHEQSFLPAFSTRKAMNRAAKFAWFRSHIVRWAVIGLLCIVGAAVLYAYTRIDPNHSITQSQTAENIKTDAVKKPPNPKRPQAAQARTKPVSDRPYPLQPHVQQPLTAGQMPSVTMPEPVPGKIQRNSENFSASRGSHDPSSSRNLPSMESSSPPKPGVQAQKPAATPRAPFERSAAAAQTQALQPQDRSGLNPPAETSASAESLRTEAPERKRPSFQQEDSLYANAERMTDGRLKVQAIVWAPDAEERMAVINSRIVREGAVVEGFTIVGIGEDAVYVREEGMRLLKVPFGKP